MSRERRPELLAPILAEASGGTARLNIYGYFDSDGAPFGVSAEDFGKVLADLPDDTDTIDLHIHSRGGDVFEAVAVAQQLREHKATINATVDGLAASSASFVAVSADKLTMSPDSSLMIHDGSVALFLARLSAEDCSKLANSLTHVNNKIASIYASKAGGTTEDWRAAMAGEQWYSADEAVAAKLADAKSAGRAAEPAAAAALDTSHFTYADRASAPDPFMPAIQATQTPAEPPETPPTDHKEADTMSDDLKGLRERLGLPEDADLAAIEAKIDADHEANEQKIEDLESAVESAKAETPAGTVTVNASAFEELKIAAKAGQEARAVQLRTTRDEAITAAVRDGRIAPARKDHWTAQWDADPEGTRAALDGLDPVHPVGELPGYAGAPNASMADDDALYQAMFGTDEKASV